MTKLITIRGRRVAFISWHRHWKGIYLHCLPRYTVRVFLWGIDWWHKGGDLKGGDR